MTTDPAVTLANWFSPGRPIRAFTFSNRLPWAVQSGELSSEDDVCLWVETLLRDGPGYHDAMCVSSAYEARTEVEIVSLNALYQGYCEAVQRTHEVAEQTEVFSRVIRRLYDLDLSSLTYPIAVGRAAALKSMPLEITLRLFLESFAARLVSAASTQLRVTEQQLAAIKRNLSPVITEVGLRSMNVATKDSVPTQSLSAVLRPDKNRLVTALA